MKPKTIITLAAALLLFGCGKPDTPAVPTPIPLADEKIGPLMDSVVNGTAGGFSGAVLVSRGEDVVFSKGYGMADRQKGVANTPQTAFAVGWWFSVPFVAVAVLQLEEKGLLDVNEPIETYLADYGIDQRVTAHDLLTHSSGIPDIYAPLGGVEGMHEDEAGFKEAFPKPIEELVDLFKDEPLEFTPGDRLHFTAADQLLLRLLIRETSGQDLEDYLHEHLFKPLGMSNTRFCDTGTRSEPRAIGYETKDSETPAEEWAYAPLTTGRHGTGLLCTTVEDMYRFGQELRLGTLIGKDSIAAMFSPYVELKEASPVGGSLGYAWGVAFPNQRREFVTFGTRGPGAGAMIRWYPGEATFVVMLSNSSHAQHPDGGDLWVPPGGLADLAFAATEEER